MERVRINFFYLVSSEIVITVPGGSREACRVHSVLFHRGKNLALIILRRFVDFRKPIFQLLDYLFPEIINFVGNTEFFVCIRYIHL